MVAMSPAEGGSGHVAAGGENRIKMPSVIGNYFDARNRRDLAALCGSFSPSASIRDERIEYTGSAEIRQWLERVNAYDLSFEVVDVKSIEDGFVAVVRVSGNVPGSPFTLRYTFRLSGALIVRLEIDLFGSTLGA